MERGSGDGGKGGRGKLESCVELLWGVKGIWGERVGVVGERGECKEKNKADHVSGKQLSSTFVLLTSFTTLAKQKKIV